MDDDSPYVTMGEAADMLGLDRRQLRRLVQRMKLEQVDNPVDARQRLIRRNDLEQLRPFASKKAVA
jgi:Helix-turn-helix domain